jgi:magnesium transporter
VSTVVQAPPEAEDHPPVIHIMAYGPEALEDRSSTQVGDLLDCRARFPVTWVDVDGLQDISLVEKIGEVFGLHPLTIEDVLHLHQRPKVENYDGYQFIVLRMPVPHEVSPGQHLETEQVGIILGQGFVVTFQEGYPGDVLDDLRNRLRRGSRALREQGPDVLAYAILDAIVDSYFPVLEDYGEELENLEDQVMSRPRREALARIHQIKRDLLTLRRAVFPLREAVNGLLRDPTPLISGETRVYLRDCYDHTVQLLDLIETYRELAGGLIDIYLSSLSNRMNEVMKKLTILSAIFLPLSLVAGIYGMNFNPDASGWNMPELNWKFGYFFALGVMALVAALLMIYFYRKGWLRSEEGEPGQGP